MEITETNITSSPQSQTQREFISPSQTQTPEEKKTDRRIKILVIAYIAFTFAELFLPDLWGSRFTNKDMELWGTHDTFFSFLRLLDASLITALPVALLFHRKQFSRYFCFAGILSFVLDIIFIEKFMTSFTSAMDFPFGMGTASVLKEPALRITLFLVKELFKLFTVICAFLSEKKSLPFRGKKDVAVFFLMIPALLFVNMPITFPAQVTGVFFTQVEIGSLNLPCFIWLLGIAAECTVLTLIFRKRSEEDRYILLVVLSLALLFQYNQFFRSDTGIFATRFPFQVCNIACYIIPFAIFTRKKSLVHFCTSLNIFGAIAAIIVCDTPGANGLFFPLNMHYILEHTKIIVISVLSMSLHVFTPLKKSDLKGVLKGMTGLYLFILIIGTLFNTLAVVTDNVYWSCNYFYIFDGTFAANLLPALGKLFEIKVTIAGVVTFTIVQIIMYVAYLLICTGMFFLLYAFFREKKEKEKVV